MKKDHNSSLAIHKKINERVSKQQLQVIVAKVLKLMGENKTTPEICDILSVELNKSEVQIKRYIQKATRQMQESFEREVPVRRMEMEQSLRIDLKEAYNNYLTAQSDRDRVLWFKMYLDVKDRIAGFIPQEVVKKDDQVIKVEYKVVGTDED